MAYDAGTMTIIVNGKSPAQGQDVIEFFCEMFDEPVSKVQLPKLEPREISFELDTLHPLAEARESLIDAATQCHHGGAPDRMVDELCDMYREVLHLQITKDKPAHPASEEEGDASSGSDARG